MSEESKFDCIPPEVMGDILDYLDSGERQKLRRVSMLWNRNITNLYGVTLAVNNVNLEMTLGCSHPRIVSHFQYLTLPMPMTETGVYFMNRLTSLSLTGMIVCYNIFPVFENCVHIRKLELINFKLNLSLKQYEVNTEDPSKLLPQLRAVTIKFRERSFDVIEYKFLKTLLPFFKPLNSDIGKLDTIVLESAGTGGPLEISLNNIFEKDCIVVPDPDIFDNYPIPPIGREIANQFYVELVQANWNTLRYLELADGVFGTRFKMTNFWKTEGKKDTELQISKFEQTMTGDRHYFFQHGASLIFMSPFLSTQTHLTTLSVLLSTTLSLDQVYAIANGNATTLKSLSIRHFGEAELNASSISQLNKLESLKLQPIFCYQEQIDWMFVGSNARIININHLSTSLRVLIIFGSFQFLNDEDYNEAFFNNLPNLEILKILTVPVFRFPNKKTYVMESLDIRRLIAWLPKLRELVLRNCRPPVQIIENPNPTWTTKTVDTLPNCATDWISTKTFISFQKIPFIDSDPGIPDEKSDLFKTAPRFDWDDDLHRASWGAAVYGFPVYFDGVILIEPQFRGKYGISD